MIGLTSSSNPFPLPSSRGSFNTVSFDKMPLDNSHPRSLELGPYSQAKAQQTANTNFSFPIPPLHDRNFQLQSLLLWQAS